MSKEPDYTPEERGMLKDPKVQAILAIDRIRCHLFRAAHGRSPVDIDELDSWVESQTPEQRTQSIMDRLREEPQP